MQSFPWCQQYLALLPAELQTLFNRGQCNAYCVAQLMTHSKTLWCAAIAGLLGKTREQHTSATEQPTDMQRVCSIGGKTNAASQHATAGKQSLAPGLMPATAQCHPTIPQRPAATAGGQDTLAGRQTGTAADQPAASPAASIFGRSIASDPLPSTNMRLLHSREPDPNELTAEMPIGLSHQEGPQQAVAECSRKSYAEVSGPLPAESLQTGHEQQAAQAVSPPSSDVLKLQSPEASTPTGGALCIIDHL